jgi:CBS domain-containing protein
MNVREVMTPNPVCCLPNDSAQDVARTMCESDVGSIPVVTDRKSHTLVGIITDRDLCCSVVAQGLDPLDTTIGMFMRSDPVACRPDEELVSCESAMQRHQVRRIPVVDEDGRCIGIVAQADIALALDPPHVHRTLMEISRNRTIAA